MKSKIPLLAVGLLLLVFITVGSVSALTVMYDGNGYTGGVAPVDPNNPYSNGDMVTVLPSGSLVKSGFAFNGWNTIADGSGVHYDVGDSFTIDANKVLYAQWRAPIVYRTVTYFDNGATIGNAPVDGNSPYIDGAIVTVLDNIGTPLPMSRVGYSFIGWNTLPGGAGTSYLPGSAFVIHANKQLFAQWKLIPLTKTVTYYGNGNTGGTAPIDTNSPYPPFGIVTIMGKGSLTKSGYLFTGWNTAADGSGFWLPPGINYMSPGNLDLYAQWEIPTITHTVKYWGNGWTGGSVPVDNTLYPAGATVTVEGPGTMVRSGYAFNGWNTQPGGGGFSIQPGETFIIPVNVNLYAQWIQPVVTHTLYYDGNGNTAGTAPIDYSSPYPDNTPVTVKGPGTLLKNGYSFTGWNTAFDGTGITYLPGNNFNIVASTTLYAQWSAPNNKNSVTYLKGYGGPGPDAPLDVNSPYTPGATVTILPPGTMVRPGFAFTGWMLMTISDPPVSHLPGDTFTISQDTWLVAQWTNQIVQRTVTYNANGGSGAVPVDGSSPYLNGATVTVKPAGALNKPGFPFLGWNTAADGSGTSYAPGATFPIWANTVLYAQWTQPITYTVAYNGNGGSGAAPVDSTAYPSGATVIVMGQGGLSKAGFTFNGWNTASDGSGASYAAGGSFPITSNMVLYARWIPVSPVDSITVVSPNGGESWQRGTPHMVTWTYTGTPGPVKIVLLNGGVAVGTATASTPLGSGGSGSFLWNIYPTGSTGGNFQIEVSSVSNPSIKDTSDAYFTLTPVGGPIPASITVNSPNGGEVWKRGTCHPVTWSSSGSPGPNVKIVLYKGTVAVGTATSSTPNDGSFNWCIYPTGSTGGNFKILVQSITTPGAQDKSNNYFTLNP